MGERRQNLIVGLFAVFGLVALCTMVVFFGGGRSLFASTYNIKVHFREGVIGVQAGQSVTLYGKRIGETTDVEFNDPEDLSKGVNVIVAISAEFDIPTKSRVQVPENIMGIGRPSILLEVLDITDRTTLPRDGSGEIPGRMQAITDKVLGENMLEDLNRATREMADLAAALKPVAIEVARLLQSRDLEDVDLQTLTANLDSVIQRFDGVLRHANTIFGSETNQANLEAMLANLAKMSESGIDVMAELSSMAGEGKKTLLAAQPVLSKLGLLTDDLSLVMKHLDKSLVALNEGKGTAGLMLYDNRFYEELVVATRRLTATLDDLREFMEFLEKEGIAMQW